MLTNLKRQVGDLLTSKVVHKSIVQPAITDGFLKSNNKFICVRDQAPYLQSLIFWNLYERSEVRLIRKFLKRDIPVVELGASLGMTSLAICSTVGESVSVVSVEANPKLFNNLYETRKRNALNNLTLLSAAVDYSGESNTSFILDDSNLGSHKGVSENSVLVPTIRLCDLILKNQIRQFSLVCDIEGAELDMFMNETHPRVVDGCLQIIIELHPVTYNGKHYTRSEVSGIIEENFHMKTVYSDGKTWVFEKNGKTVSSSAS
jgi:FkbM family methyltransferase